MSNVLSRRLLVLVAFAGAGSAALAGTVRYDLDITKFGKVMNVGDNCGPTSTANSFVYLQNRYSDVLKGDNRIVRDGTGAVTDDASKLRDALGAGWGDKTGGRAGMGVNGTTLKPWWAAKVQWLEDYAPGKISYDAQMYNEKDAKNWNKGAGIEDCYPTIQFLWDSLNHGADIELNIIDVPFKKAHALTLVGLAFDDANDDKKWQAGEKLTMRFVDPNDPEQKNKDNIQPVELKVGTDGRFEFKWWQDQGQWYIDSALTETVPGPATWVLSVAAGGMCVRRRRR